MEFLNDHKNTSAASGGSCGRLTVRHQLDEYFGPAVTNDLGIVQQDDATMKWFEDAKFGMFLHWGIYAVPAKGEWFMEKRPRVQSCIATSPMIGAMVFILTPRITIPQPRHKSPKIPA